jgi:competence protein ComEC
MFHIALSLLAGILSLNLFSELPGNIIYLALFVAVTACYFKTGKVFKNVNRSLVIFVFGMCWAQLHASNYQKHVLPEALAGKDFVITGTICDIPASADTEQRFMLEVEEFIAHDYSGPVPEKLKLSWYYGEPVRAGESWQFNVRLKPPHGFMNPGGFDYEAWLFQNGINATGYVRKSEINRKLQPAALLDSTATRQVIAENIDSVLHDSAFAGFVAALAVGDRSAIDPHQWRVLINTGTNHLMAISGLHIGLAAAFGYFLCRRLLPARAMQFIPAQHAAMISAVIIALAYAILAGFAIPTQRALLMLLCVACASLLRRTSRPMDVLALALVLVLLWDPASVMSAGFWFSFLAVAVIFHALTGRMAQSRWLKWGWMQIVIALALFPMSFFMFQQTSLVSPLANLFMVPYVSLLVVPLVLLALVMLPLSAAASAALFSVAGGLFELIWPVLQWLSEFPYSHWIKPQPGLLATILALLGVGIMLAPRVQYWRAAGVLLLIPALAWQPRAPQHGGYELNVLDVGQGLAIVVRTHSHTLVYDTGARFSERLDSGKAVLLPFLVHEGIESIDLLMISHGDDDHIGGAASLLEVYPQTPVLGQGIEELAAASRNPCKAGQKWQWDGVDFTLLHPDGAVYTATNNRSCVLKITGMGGSALLTGDIEQKVEARLLQHNKDLLSADILIAPHHGSKSSSGTSFIEAVSPQIVVFAAGYRNRYRFPKQEIVERFAKQGAQMYMSGHAGAIRMLVHPRSGIAPVESYRENHGKYWNQTLPKLRQDR